MLGGVFQPPDTVDQRTSVASATVHPMGASRNGSGVAVRGYALIADSGPAKDIIHEFSEARASL